MAEVKMQASAEQQQAQEQKQVQRSDGKALEKMGGFMTVKGFIPALSDMNPAKQATRNIFLTDKKNEKKRENLANELRSWLEVLSEDKSTHSEYVELCKQKEEKYRELLGKNVTTALECTKQLETAYRSLDSFFKNANADKLYNLRLMNVSRQEIEDESSLLSGEVDKQLREGFDQLSLKESYSLLVIPGHVMRNKTILLKWARIAHKYKVLLITDHHKESNYDNLLEETSDYNDSDVDLQNVVMTGNWIVGRKKENLSDTERESDDKAFFIPPAAALAGKLYDETANMAQGAGGKKYGTLNDVKGVELDLLKSEIAALMDNQIVPMVYSDGRVMAFNNSTLYNGDNKAMTEYPIVRVFDWVKKVLMNFVNDNVLNNWNTYTSPGALKKEIQTFLDQYQGYGNLFQKYSIEEPTQDPVTKRISVDIQLTPYYAAKNFTIKLTADKKEKDCEVI